MPAISLTLRTPVRRSFRVEQIAGLFDLPLEEESQQSFNAEIPGLDEPWTIGAIVGPSGSGKSTLARAAFGEAVVRPEPWDGERAIVDQFGSLPLRDLTSLLTAVGFSSPPAWLRPYHALSTGERFRCDLARALSVGHVLNVPVHSEGRDGHVGNVPHVVVFDEFTSVVDRTAAQIGSAAVARYLRRPECNQRFVAVSCHYDILPWLGPDWVLDLATCQLARGQLQRPAIELEVAACRAAAWPVFARHHYLSGQLPRAASCYLATWRDEPVAFAATIGLFGRRGRKRLARLVVLPDFQGVGIGPAFAERVCELERSRGFGVNVTTSHPGLLAHCSRSPRWRLAGIRPTGRRTRRLGSGTLCRGSAGRGVVSFEYVGG